MGSLRGNILMNFTQHFSNCTDGDKESVVKVAVKLSYAWFSETPQTDSKKKKYLTQQISGPLWPVWSIIIDINYHKTDKASTSHLSHLVAKDCTLRTFLHLWKEFMLTT